MAEFDKYGRIRNPNFQRQPVSRFPSFNDGYGDLWQRLNRFVSNIGEWIGENGNSICTNISVGLYFLCWILYAITVIATWSKDGFLSALICGILGAIIVYYGAGILMLLLHIALRVVVFIVRFILYNIYTLMIGIALLLFCIIKVA